MDLIRGEGREAFQAGQGKDACPYLGSSEPQKANCWIGGWSEASLDALFEHGKDKERGNMNVTIDACERRNLVELGPTGSRRHLECKAVHDEVLRLCTGNVLWIAPRAISEHRKGLLPGVDVRNPLNLLRMHNDLASYDTIVVEENHAVAMQLMLPILKGHEGRVVVMFDPLFMDRDRLAELVGAPTAAAAPTV